MINATIIWDLDDDEGGLNRLVLSAVEGSNRAKSRFARYVHDPDDPHSLTHNEVNVLYESPNEPGVLWVGTQGGLNKLDRTTERFVHYGEKEGLPNEVILGIVEDHHGHLWLSTYKGLSRFDPQTETFKNYDVQDGLQSNEFNAGAYLKSKRGALFFGGINGITAFFPDEIRGENHLRFVLE